MSASATPPASPYKGLAAVRGLRARRAALLRPRARARDRRREPARVAPDRALRAERRRQELAPPGRRRPRSLRADRTMRRVVVFSSWAGDPRSGFAGCDRRGCRDRVTRHSRRAAPGRVRRPSAATSTSSSTSSRSTSSTTSGEPVRRASSPAAVARAGPPRRTSSLALREDALAKLDAFKGRIPNLFANYLRLDHLDRAARARRSSARSSATTSSPARRSSIEPELVEAVLDQVAAGRVDVGRAGRGGVGDGRASGSRRRTSSSCSSGSGKRSARQRLDGAPPGDAARRSAARSDRARPPRARARRGSSPRSRTSRRRIFDHLVTPSGTKIAHRRRRPRRVRGGSTRPTLDAGARASSAASGSCARSTASGGGPSATRSSTTCSPTRCSPGGTDYEAQRELERATEAERRHRRLLAGRRGVARRARRDGGRDDLRADPAQRGEVRTAPRHGPRR